jgi:hypothetical protein
MQTRFAVAHLGAREHYSVPEALMRKGMLDRLYTDVAIPSVVYRAASCVLPPRFQGAIRTRSLPVGLWSRTTCFPDVFIRDKWRQRTRRDGAGEFERLMALREDFNNCLARYLPGTATHMIGMFLEAVPSMARCRKQGIPTVMEVYLAPQTACIMVEENSRHPELADDIYDVMAQNGDSLWKEAIAATDYFVAPSSFVAEGLQQFGINKTKIAIVPYGTSSRFANVVNDPVPGRVLFVGTAELRKGIHTLAESVDFLPTGRFEVRVAGNSSVAVQRLLASKGVYYLGRIPHGDIERELSRADVFVLPSLAEGSALVIYEALSAGVPVITTANSGSIVHHEQNGLLIKACDSIGLAEAIQRVVGDRALRNTLAEAARETGKHFLWKDYGSRFVAAIERCLAERVSANKR